MAAQRTERRLRPEYRTVQSRLRILLLLTAAVSCAVLAREPVLPPEDGVIDRRAARELRRLFPTADDLTEARHSAGREGLGDSVTVFVPRSRGLPLGLAVLCNVRGKEQPITMLVATDTALAVLALEIIAYREPYGGEIQNEMWRAQFRGAAPGRAMRHGRDIRNITGATISARSATAGVNAVLRLLPSLAQRYGLLP